MITELRVNRLAGLVLDWEEAAEEEAAEEEAAEEEAAEEEAAEEEATDSDDIDEEAISTFDELLLLNMDKKVDWIRSNANTEWTVLRRWWWCVLDGL